MTSAVNTLLQPISSYVELLKRSSKSPKDIVPPNAEDIINGLTQLRTNLPVTTQSIKKSMSLYLANSDTENILFKPIRVSRSPSRNSLYD